MGQDYTIGSTNRSAAVAELPSAPGVTRLQVSRQQPVDQAQDGPWVVLFSDGGWQLFYDKDTALDFRQADPDCFIGSFNEIDYAQTRHL